MGEVQGDTVLVGDEPKDRSTVELSESVGIAAGR